MCGSAFEWIRSEAAASWVAAGLLLWSLLLIIRDGNRREDFERSRSRAHVRLICERVEVSPAFGGGFSVKVPFYLRNMGSTAAVNVMAKAQIQAVKSAAEVRVLRHAVNMVFEAMDDAGDVIAALEANGSSVSDVAHEGFDALPSKDGLRYAFFYAIVQYDDVLGNTWVREIARKITIVDMDSGRAFIQPSGSEHESKHKA